MADPILEFDAAASNIDGSNPGSALTITTGNYGFNVLSSPAPPVKVQWASSVDTEGALAATTGHENRTITINLDVTTDASLNTLTGKLAKLHREGGTLKHTGKDGTVVIADIQAMDTYEPAYDHLRLLGDVTQVQFTLPARPYLRGTEVELGSDTVETTLPYMQKTVTGPAGDWYALGRLLIDNDQAVDQWWLTWGLESRNYSSSANAALFYEAEGRTALGGSAIAAGPSGASGAGSNVMRNTALSTDYLAILSTQATGAGAHLSHVGLFHAYMRVQVPTTNAGEVTVALEWAEADFLRYTRNSATTIPAEHEGRWRLVDLGLVSLTKVIAGTQRWEGRIVAKSTVSGDDIDIDYLLLIPASEGAGIASGVERSFTPTAYVAEDRFTSTTAGVALNARVAPTGGTWATSGAATDFAFSDDVIESSTENLKRSTTTQSTGRAAILGSTDYAGVIVESLSYIASSATPTVTPVWEQGVVARWVDSSNYLRAVLVRDSTSGTVEKTLEIRQVVAGVETLLVTTVASDWPGTYGSTAVLWRLRLTVTAAGRAVAELISTGEGIGTIPAAGTVVLSVDATTSVLATGSTLATGKPGIWDRNQSTTVINRYYDDFLVASIPAAAAAFASQSIEIRHDRVVREDSGGTLWVKPSSYLGDYLLIPPTGAEGRSVRVIAKFARNDPLELDNGIDDLSARLFAIPRFLTFPD